MNARIRVVASLLLLACGGCAPESTGVDGAIPSEIPHPELLNLEPAVRQKLGESREQLESVLRSPEASPSGRGSAYGRLGMLYQAYGLMHAAAAAYRNAEVNDPGDLRWPYYAAGVQRELGTYEEAAASFRRAIRIRENDLPALVQLAEVEAGLGRNESAEDLFERALELDPSCAPALVGLGQLAAGRKQFDEAVRRFEAALRIAPRATAVNYPLGLAYRALGRDDEALARLEQRGVVPAALDDPLLRELETLASSWVIQLNRGTELIRAGSYEAALGELRQAAEAAPENAAVRLNMGSALTHLGRFDEANRAFEEAARLDPNDATPRFNLGTLAAKSGDDPAAVEQYRLALGINPAMTNVHFNLANALRRLGRFEESAEHYRAFVDHDRGNEAARLGEIFALIRIDRHAEALQRLEEGREALPESRQLRNAQARLLAAAPQDDLRDGPRALTLARGLVEEQRSLPFVVTLAMAAAEAGDFPLALQWQQAAVDSVRRTGDSAMLSELERNLEHYRNDRPCRLPWRKDDPVLSP